MKWNIYLALKNTCIQSLYWILGSHFTTKQNRWKQYFSFFHLARPHNRDAMSRLEFLWIYSGKIYLLDRHLNWFIDLGKVEKKLRVQSESHPSLIVPRRTTLRSTSCWRGYSRRSPFTHDVHMCCALFFQFLYVLVFIIYCFFVVRYFFISVLFFIFN